MRTLLRMVDAVAPLATLALQRDRDKLLGAIEGLGLHGLVNCGQNKLIEVTDAVRMELATHIGQLKLTAGAMDKALARDPKAGPPLLPLPHMGLLRRGWVLVGKDHLTLFLYSINGMGKTPAPSQSSHQRLMKLRVSDVRLRLQRNRVSTISQSKTEELLATLPL